jgi:excisionase family DNA binding protein
LIELVPQPANAVVVAPIEIQLYTVRQTAQVLQVSERTIFNLLASGQLRSVKIGGSRRVFSDDLKEFARVGVDAIKKASEGEDEDAAS